MPLRKFGFGPTAKPPLIRLEIGDLGGKRDVFFMNAYDHYGAERHTVTHTRSGENYTGSEYFSYVNNLYSVSYVDLSCLNIYSHHLKQLAVVCPNLQRLNLHGNIDCLKDLQGLSAIVHSCQNLEGLNLSEISVLSVESCVLLWELLSRLKKLTHLAIELCLLDFHMHSVTDADEEKLITSIKGCYNLQALEINSGGWFMDRDCIKGCVRCYEASNFLFSHFPSLTHCRMSNFQHSALTYALNNCHQLKYLYEDTRQYSESQKLLGNCNLQQLYIGLIPRISHVHCDEFLDTLSAHGKLETVILRVHSITERGITTLINNSPNLTLLYISIEKPMFDLGSVRDLFPSSYRHKLFSVGSFNVVHASGLKSLHAVADNTDLDSLWPPNFAPLYI